MPNLLIWKKPTKPNWTKWDHTGPYRTIWDHTGPYRTIRIHMRPYGTIQNHRRPYGTLTDHTGPNETIWDHTVSYLTIWDHTWPYRSIQTGSYGSIRTILSHTWPFMTLWDHPGDYPKYLGDYPTYSHNHPDYLEGRDMLITDTFWISERISQLYSEPLVTFLADPSVTSSNWKNIWYLVFVAIDWTIPQSRWSWSPTIPWVSPTIHNLPERSVQQTWLEIWPIDLTNKINTK